MNRLERWVTGPQMRQLRRLSDQPDADHAWLAARADALASHVRNLSTREKIKKVVYRIWHMLMPIRHWIMGMLYPVMHTESPAGKAHVADEVRAGRASRLNLITDDHVQLDALLVHGPNRGQAKRRVIVFALPNAETYEGYCATPRETENSILAEENHYGRAYVVSRTRLPDGRLSLRGQPRIPTWGDYEAPLVATAPEAWARGLGCDVLMFNYRGAGSSLGHINSTRDGVMDTRAAIEHALREYDHVSVWGVSIGGATAIEALAGLKDDGKIDADSIDSLLAHHSFTSLDRVIGELTRSAIVRWLARAALWCVGSSRLHAKRHLTEQRLAQRTLVTRAESDRIIRGKAPLADTEPCPAWVTTVTWGEDHCDMAAPEIPPLLQTPFGR